MTTSRLIDVTPQILEFHRIYGGSDNTNPSRLSSSRCLNYSEGGSIQRAEKETVTDIPQQIEYKDAVGLFGTENHFIKLSLRLENPITGDYVINEYEPARITQEIPFAGDPYTLANNGYNEPGQAYIDLRADLEIVNTFEPAEITNDTIPNFSRTYFKVELNNLKTGNKYIDSWLDIRLYNRYYDEHPYDVMYVKHNEPFYIGFHARNTKRLPYNVLCSIADYSDDPKLPPFGELNEFDNRLLATKR